MKRILIILALVIFILLMAFLPAVALADTSADAVTVEPSPQFFTWAMLLTYAGATAATIAVTQIFKGVGGIARIPTRFFAYIVALVIMIMATLLTGGGTLSAILLCFINAVVVALAASGAYDAMQEIKGQ